MKVHIPDPLDLPGLPDHIHIPEPSIIVAGIVFLIVFSRIRKKKRQAEEDVRKIPDL